MSTSTTWTLASLSGELNHGINRCLTCVLVICIALLVFVVILGFDPDLLVLQLRCDLSGGIGSTLSNLPDLIFFGQFLNYSSSLSTGAAVLLFQYDNAAVRQCRTLGAAVPRLY